MSKFIVFEGMDGAGKSTQVNLLIKYLETENVKYKYLHFPMTDSEIFGGLISRYLRGEFGNINDVNPYLVALIYAGDRRNAKKTISTYLADGYLLIVDRYVNSNIAFQCAKVDNSDEKSELMEWIIKLEYGYYSIPKPDISLYLDVPFSFVENKLSEERVGREREYLDGKTDIHENSLELQKKVRIEYLELINEKDFYRINCINDKDQRILNTEEIRNLIFGILRDTEIIK